MHKKEIRGLICAMLLGDGSFTNNKVKNKKCYSTTFGFSHSIKQEDYLLYKVKLINDIFVKKNLERRMKISYYTAHLNYKNKKRNYKVTKARLHWAKYFKYLYPKVYKYKNGKPRKSVEYLLSQIHTDKHLFLWFADDGCEIRIKKKHKDSKNEYIGNPRLRLYTNSFNEGEINLIKEWFQKNYSVTPMIHHSGVMHNKKPILNFSTKDSKKLFSHIVPYVKSIPSIKKKFFLSVERYC